MSLPPATAHSSAEVRARKAAQVRGVTSIAALRDAIRAAARALPPLTDVPRLRTLDRAGFQAQAERGLPFVITGVVGRWPLCTLTADVLRARFGAVPVRARVGDYIGTAFAPDRAMQDMTLAAYLDLVAHDGAEHGSGALPPYVGNLEIGALNAMCHWPGWFGRMGPPRFWLGPAGTVTPLHCDYDDNIFAQALGSKRICLAPPHHDEYLYTREANPVLYGSPFDPERPDYDRFPRARGAAIVDVVVQPGEMLYVPAGWYHQVRALSFSLSVNRWSRGMPLALRDDPALRAGS